MKQLFTWDDLTDNPKSAPKKLTAAFKRAGEELAGSWVDGKTRRENGTSYRVIGLVFSDSQRVDLRVKSTGDVYQVRLNNKVLPIKEQDDQNKAVAEIVAAAQKNAKRFQAAMLRRKTALPKDIKTTTKRREEAAQDEERELDASIADARRVLREEFGEEPPAPPAELSGAVMDAAIFDGER